MVLLRAFGLKLCRAAHDSIRRRYLSYACHWEDATALSALVWPASSAPSCLSTGLIRSGVSRYHFAKGVAHAHRSLTGTNSH